MTCDKDDVVRVYAGPLVLVETYRRVLVEAGIECRVVGTELASGLGSALPESIELWVHQSDLARATEVLERESLQKDERSHYRPRHHLPQTATRSSHRQRTGRNRP